MKLELQQPSAVKKESLNAGLQGLCQLLAYWPYAAGRLNFFGIIESRQIYAPSFDLSSMSYIVLVLSILRDMFGIYLADYCRTKTNSG